jgi:hypothetical protein
MDFRQNAARRRRVMRDERPEVAAVVAAPTQQPLRRYCTEEVLASQPTLLQFLPKQPWLVAVVLTLTLSAAGLILLAPLIGEQMRDSGRSLSVSPLELLDAGRSGSLAQVGLQTIAVLNWVLAYQIFHLRRHREDDYHGVYQVWWWCLWPLGIVSLLSSGAVAELLLAVLKAWYPAEWLAATTWGVVATGVVIAGFLVPRLFAELKECLPGRVFLVLATVSAVGFAVVRVATNFDALAGTAALLTTTIEWWVLLNVFSFACLQSALSFVATDVMGQRDAVSESSRESERDSTESGVRRGESVGSERSSNDVARQTEPAMDAAERRDSSSVQVGESEGSVEESDANLLQRRKRRRAA